MTTLPAAMTAITIAGKGGPEVLRPETIAVPQPGPGQLRLPHHSARVIGGAEGRQLHRVAVLAQHPRQVPGAQVLQFFGANQQRVQHTDHPFQSAS